MKALRILLTIVLLIGPAVARILWFYNGQYSRPTAIAMPDYKNLSAPILPLSTPEAAPVSGVESTHKTIVVDMAHDNLFDLPEIETLTRQLTGRGARLQVIQGKTIFMSELGDALKRASAYVVIAPMSNFTLYEVRQVQRFVEQGGRVLVIADPTRLGIFVESVTAPNSLLVPFDLAFSDDYLYNLAENEGNYRNVIFRQFAADPLTQRLASVVLYATRSVNTSAGTPLIRASEATLSSHTDTGGDLAASALSADGQVLALGDLTFLTPPYNQVADNSRLIGNLADFLLGGQRTREFTDMPFLFTRPVSILPTRNITLTADLVESLGQLQTALRADFIASTVISAPVDGHDRIVLGSYSPSGDFLPYVRPFYPVLAAFPLNIDIKNPNTFVELPGVGKVKRWGTGVMVLDRADERTTLILIADDPDRLSSLVDIVATGAMENCAFQGQYALCNLLASDEDREPPGKEQKRDADTTP